MIREALDAQDAFEKLATTHLKLVGQAHPQQCRELADMLHALDMLAKEANTLRLCLEEERSENRRMEKRLDDARRERDSHYEDYAHQKRRADELQKKLEKDFSR